MPNLSRYTETPHHNRRTCRPDPNLRSSFPWDASVEGNTSAKRFTSAVNRESLKYLRFQLEPSPLMITPHAGFVSVRWLLCLPYILQQLYGAMIGAGIYYMTWVLKNKNLFGQFAWAVNIPLIIALIFTPTLVGKWKGMYKLNLRGYVLAVIGRALVVVAGYMGSVPLMMAFTALAALGQGPWQGDMNAVIASCSEYTYLTQRKRIDGTMYSCTSLGVKIGGGIGTAVVGWMLEFSGYVGTNATQPQSALDMMQFMYLWFPLIFDVLIMLVLSRMNVEDVNEKLKAEKGIVADEVTDVSDIN